MPIECHARTDIGRRRRNNEDSHLLARLSDGMTLAVVADGVGGAPAGDVASRLAVACFTDACEQGVFLELGLEWTQALREQVLAAHRRIAAAAVGAQRGMATTLTAVLADERNLAVAHVGDSRLYRADHDGLVQLTPDRTVVADMVASGQLTVAASFGHPDRHRLTQVIGTDLEDGPLEPFLMMTDWSPDDRLLLCSDGLTEMVADEHLADLCRGPSAAAIVDGLIAAALAAGGVDNVTVLVLVNQG